MRNSRIASVVTASALLLVGGLTACGSGGSGGTAAAQHTTPSATGSTTASGTAPTPGAGSAAASASASAPASAGAPAPVVDGLGPKEALLVSAAVMEKAGSAKLMLSGGGKEQTGSYSWKAPAALELSTNPADGQGKMLVTAGAMYIGMDDESAAQFDGKHWLRIDPKAATGTAGAAVPGREDAGSMTTLLQTLNPAVQLAANAEGGRLTKVGVENVGIVAASHYRSELPVEALVNAMKGLSDDLRKQVVDTLKKNGASVTTDFWINGRGELLQQRSDNVGNGSKDAVTVTYSDLGSATQVKAPAASDVMDFADMLKGATSGG